MQGKSKVLFRQLAGRLQKLMDKDESALILGPRQVGKTTLVKSCLPENSVTYTLADPSVRLSFEKDPSLIIRQLKAREEKTAVFIDEAQKVPEIFDAVQYLIDEKVAAFILTGSSARKLKRKGMNLLPGRIRLLRLDPLSWSELGFIRKSRVEELFIENTGERPEYTFEKSLIFGSLPGVVMMDNDEDRKEFLKSYTSLYLEEEIRAEALSRKIGAFSRFLELAARESGTSPNLSKLSMESGVSSPAVKEFYHILEDTLIVERVEPYLKNARKRLLSFPRYYFFDPGVRNSLARMPLSEDLIKFDKGVLFEHFVILELIRRVRLLNRDYKLCFWRTSGGAEVDCIIDTGSGAIPLEIKCTSRISSSDLKSLNIFLKEYHKVAKTGYVITQSGEPEQVDDNVYALPWYYL